VSADAVQERPPAERLPLRCAARPPFPRCGHYRLARGRVGDGEPVPAADAGHVADVADDRGGDDRAHVDAEYLVVIATKNR
jgi:hypothetical protein